MDIEGMHFQGSVEVTFRNLSPSKVLEEFVYTKLKRLKQHYPFLHGCRIVVDCPHQHHRQGNNYSVSISMVVPSKELSVNHDHHEPKRATNAHKAVTEAFGRAERLLQDYRGKLRRHEPHFHEQPTVGRVVRIIAGEQKGYIETIDGREFFFDSESLLEGPFEKVIEVGDTVAFSAPDDDRPPHATGVIRQDVDGKPEPSIA